MSELSVSPKQLQALLVPAIQAHEPVLIKGAPGVGKSDIEEAAAKAAGADNLISHPVTADPTDAKGLPWKVDGRDAATFLPYGDLEIAMNAKGPLVWFLDDLGQASPAVQASFMQLILARRINGHKLPDHVSFIAATNRRSDRAGVSGILEPVKSRFTIIELKTTFEDWREWAVTHAMPASLIGYLSNRPEMLSKFGATQDISNSPCPRNWAAVGRWQEFTPRELRPLAFAGRVGEAEAAAYTGFLEMLEKAPDPDAILMDPDKAPIPSNEDPGICYAVALALAYRANQKTFGSIAIYAERLHEADLPEFSTLLMRDSVRKMLELKIVVNQLPTFQKIAGKPFVKDIFAAFTDEK